jgi:DNA polymerase/3'-5' exonuclease PolX
MNSQLVDGFDALLKLLEKELIYANVNGGDINSIKRRYDAIKRGYKLIKGYPTKIKSGKELMVHPGIGKGIAARVDEILETGTLEELSGSKIDDEKKKEIQGIMELEEIYGIGPKKIKQLINEYKITNVKQLKKAYKEGKIKLTDAILQGLKYHGLYKKNIPRSETEKIEKLLSKTASKIDPDLEITIAGSYRRGNPTSGDIDVLLVHSQVRTMTNLKKAKISCLDAFVKKLTKIEFLLDDLTSEGPTKYMGWCQLDKNPVRRIDIRWMPYDHLHAGLLYFTGPYELNTYMRITAKKMGYTLNEYGLYDSDKNLIVTETEKDIFKELGLKYLKPEKRNDFIKYYE